MTKKETEPTYEDMIAELREIAKQLDDPNTAIEDAVKLHQRGMALIQKCETFLQKAELTITEVPQQSDSP
ncbi:MAG TPA: exodeoxyribonuclease VII small subunit [Methanocorpusculum sp.]|nr:exodeoxyribonuclease VII small subunit [Methanocorpusculum sp.]HJJ53127.1 exodeoxyribonuclease VII small subunit [Methanocorpusculum sp.]HKL97115.1 exodeoxyribonuclease VII small subunit [Methanocorpusculum sp.]